MVIYVCTVRSIFACFLDDEHDDDFVVAVAALVAVDHDAVDAKIT